MEKIQVGATSLGVFGDLWLEENPDVYEHCGHSESEFILLSPMISTMDESNDDVSEVAHIPMGLDNQVVPKRGCGHPKKLRGCPTREEGWRRFFLRLIVIC